MNNSIMLIQPYRMGSAWVFDDPAVGLLHEPFVAGIDLMLDRMTEDIKFAEWGFSLLFSATPFPSHTIRLEQVGAEGGGTWYRCEKYGITGWLCPALFKYFKQAPKELYVEARSK